jgi:hypothetical protein
VLRAIAEFETVGRDQFLTTHGFGRARRFVVDLEGRRFDSKAIVGVAHGYDFPDLGQLDSGDFSGGQATVVPLLERLGFTVEFESNPLQVIDYDGRALSATFEVSGRDHS